MTDSTPSPFRLSTSGVDAIRAALADAISMERMPGAVVHVQRAGQHWSLNLGERSQVPVSMPAQIDTVYDCASLTKVIVTAPLALKLVEDAQIERTTSVGRVLKAPNLNEVSIRHLLTHTSGLPAGVSRSCEWSGRDEAFRLARSSLPLSSPGTGFLYSDINFIILTEVIEAIYGMRIDMAAAKYIFEPLNMNMSGFLPTDWCRLEEIAPTEVMPSGEVLHGAVHDPTARRMAGVSGHAGLFSCASDIAKFASAMLGGTPPTANCALSPRTIAWMSEDAVQGDIGVKRTMGWDMLSPTTTANGENYSSSSFGHTGFTGCALWIDPQQSSFFTLLSNRVHPYVRQPVTDIYSVVATHAARLFCQCPVDG